MRFSYKYEEDIYKRTVHYENDREKSMNFDMQFSDECIYLDSRMTKLMIFIQNHDIKSFRSFAHIFFLVILSQSLFNNRIDDSTCKDVIRR
jgi:hypothetical protein